MNASRTITVPKPKSGSQNSDYSGLLNAIALSFVVPSAWQVHDSRVPEGSEGHLVGFIQESQGTFEVMQLAETFLWATFGSMADAIEHIARTNAEVMVSRKRGDLGWILNASALKRSVALSFLTDVHRHKMSVSAPRTQPLASEGEEEWAESRTRSRRVPPATDNEWITQ